MAYNTATLVQKDPPGEDRRVRLVVEFTGNAGEPLVRREYYVTASDTTQTIRRWCIEQAKNLGDVKTVADAITVGQSVNLTPINPPTPTAEEVWRAKVARYQRMAVWPHSRRTLREPMFQRICKLLLLALLWPGASWAITLSEAQTGTEDGADNAFSMSAQNLAAGSINLVCAKWEGAVTLTSFTDTASNTYTLLTNQTHSLTEPSTRCGYVLSASANAANVVTANFSGSASFKRGTVYEFTYSGTASFDVEAGSTEDDADTTPSSNTVTTTGTEEVCVAIQADYQGHTFSGHTINGQVADGTSNLGDTTTWYEIFPATFTGGASSVTRSGTARWVQRLSCFKITAGGGGGSVSRMLMMGVGP